MSNFAIGFCVLPKDNSLFWTGEGDDWQEAVGTHGVFCKKKYTPTPSIIIKTKCIDKFNHMIMNRCTLFLEFGETW